MTSQILKIVFIIILFVAGFFGFAQYTSSESFVREDREALSRTDSLSIDEHKATCERMSRWSHVAGLSDGAFVPMASTYTHYYRSSCFFELARKTRDKTYCDGVKQRWSLLSIGSRVSREVCLKEVDHLTELETTDKAKREKLGAFLAKAVRITEINLQSTSTETWQSDISMAGEIFGEYELEVTNSSAKFGDPSGILKTERLLIRKMPFQTSVTITAADLEKCGPACKMRHKRIYSLGFTLSLIAPDEPFQDPSIKGRHQVSVSNKTISIP